jgi:hypothetical protein
MVWLGRIRAGSKRNVLDIALAPMDAAESSAEHRGPMVQNLSNRAAGASDTLIISVQKESFHLNVG